MKLFKRFGAIFLSIVMLMSFGAVTASATDSGTGTLTLASAQGTSLSCSSFSAYKITTLTGNRSVNYSTQVKAALNTSLNTPTATYKDDNAILATISGLNASQAATFASALKTGIAAITADATTSNGSFANLPYGYYLIMQTGGSTADGTVLSDPILVNFDSTQTAHVKISSATITKKIVIGSKSISTATVTDDAEATTDADLFDTSTVAVGDNVHYRSLSTIPVYPSDVTGLNYTVTDSLSSGLTLNENTGDIKVYAVNGATHTPLTKDTDYTLTVNHYSIPTPATFAPDAESFTVKLTGDNNIKSLGNTGSSILITYSAILGNTNATNFGNTGNPNSVKLTYSKLGSSDFNTGWDTVITYTNRLIITKTDSAGNTLKGATFELDYSATQDGTKTKIDTQTTGDDGKLTFAKLKVGFYTLKETVAPTGYSTIADDNFTVIATNTNESVGSSPLKISDSNINVLEQGNIAAAQGFRATWSCSGLPLAFTVNADSISTSITDTSIKLPFTGGMGTVLFTTGGILLIALAGTLLLVYNKKHKSAKR